MRKLNVYRQMFFFKKQVLSFIKKVSRYFNIPQNLLDYMLLSFAYMLDLSLGPANAD